MEHFPEKLESIDGLKLNNRAEIHINKYYQGIITLYRVSRKNCEYGARKD